MSSAWLRYARNFLLVLLLMLVLLVSLVPLAVRYATVYWLEQQHLSAHFHYLELSPLRGYVTLYDVRAENSAGRGFAIEELRLTWNWGPLLQRRVDITDVSVSGVHLDIVAVNPKSEKIPHWEIAGFAIPGPEPGSAPAPASSEAPWSLQLPDIELSDVSFCLYDDRNGVAADSHAPPLCLNWGQLVLSGSTTQLALPSLNLSLPEELAINTLALRNPATDSHWITLGSLQLQGLQFDRDSVHFQMLSVLDVLLLPAPALDDAGVAATDYQLGWERLNVTQASLSASLLAAEQIDLQGFQAILVRDSGGQMLLLNTLDPLLQSWQSVLASMASSTPETTPKKVAAEPAASVFLKNLQVTKAHLVWIDKQPKSPVSEAINNINMSLGPIDSRAANESFSVIKLQAGLGDHGKLEASANFKPFMETLNAKGQVALTAVDLLPISPYSEHVLSYKVRQGLLTQTLDFTIVDDEIDALAKLQLSKFYLDPLAQAEKTGSEEDTGLPIGTALNLLRDSDNNIPLQLPIKGTVGEPSVSPNYILGVVAKKALTQAVLQYYGPFGLVSIAKAALDTATKLRFESLHFAPTSGDLSTAEKKQLAKLVELLTQRRQLSLVFCAAANYSDWKPGNKLERVETVPQLSPQQRQLLVNLAQQRNSTVKDWLLKQGVLPEQVVTCNPTLNLRSLGPAEMTVSL